MGGECSLDISETATEARSDPTIVSMFRHPLGDPSNPDLNSRAYNSQHPRARILSFNRVSR